MSDHYFLVHVESDGAGGPEEAKLIGPYVNVSLQTQMAMVLRDEGRAEHGTLLWLDLHNGVPTIGTFDPMFWEQHR